MLRSYIYKPDYIDNTIDLNSNAAKELDWMSFWEQLFVKSVNSSLDSFAHLNEELKKEQNSEKKTLLGKSVISLLPLTCHIPVIPGLMAILAL